MNLFSLFGQAWLASRVIKVLGVGLTLAILPTVVLVGFATLGISIAYLQPTTLIWVFVVVETTRKVANYSLARPTREILYTVVPRAEKYKSKSFIDTFVVRTSDPINGWINMGLRALGLSTASVLFVVMPIAGVWFVLALALGARQNWLARFLDLHDHPDMLNLLRGCCGYVAISDAALGFSAFANLGGDDHSSRQRVVSAFGQSEGVRSRERTV